MGSIEKFDVMKNLSREFQIFVKPVGSHCNLKCSYCYYLEKAALYPDFNHFRMSDDILEKYITQHIQASTEDTIIFSWHGGEPLLAGIEFYKRVLRLQSSNRPSGKVILNGIQTNATLINEEWCRFLSANNFIIGVSIDGPAHFHDMFRRANIGSTTFSKVLSGFELLKTHNIIPEVLCVVNSENVKHPLVVYNFFKQIGARYITFLPLVEHVPGHGTDVSEISVPSLEFGHFLSEIFDEWVQNDIGSVKVQIFEEAARTAFNQEHTLCIFKENCGGVPVIEHNGDFYSCDHYVDIEHMHGNINDHPVAYFLDHERQVIFGKMKSSTLPVYCLECEVRPMCNGECPKNRFIISPYGEPGFNYLCEGYKYFFNHCRPFVEAVAEAWKTQE
jgi:uncharacterized protein